jgi:DNA-binding Lrp family transcriptional regulator
MVTVDELDSAIVRHLQRDARLTNRELARLVGVAPSTCLERVRLLRTRGVITGYHAEIDLAALNRTVQALLHVQVRPLSREVIDGFRASIVALPEVLSVFVVAGADDFLVHVAVPSVDSLHAFLIDRFSKRREIIGFRTSVIYQHARNQVIEALE